MSYYYTIQEYALKEGVHLTSVEEHWLESQAKERSNKLGVKINKVPGRQEKISCYASKVLKEVFTLQPA